MQSPENSPMRDNDDLALLQQYLGQDNFTRLQELAESVDPEQSYDHEAVQALWSFIEGLLGQLDEKKRVQTLGLLRGYLTDLSLFNIPRLGVQRRDSLYR